MALPAMIIGSAALQFAGGALGAWGGYRDSIRQAHEMEKQARTARNRGLQDFGIASQQLNLQEQELMDTAVMQAKQLEIQQERISTESLVSGDQLRLQSAGRGVETSNTASRMAMGAEMLGHQQHEFSLARTATFNQHARGMKALSLQRQSLGLQFDRLGKDTRRMEKQANRLRNNAWQNLWMGIAGAGIGAGAQAGMGLVEAGAFSRTPASQTPPTPGLNQAAYTSRAETGTLRPMFNSAPNVGPTPWASQYGRLLSADPWDRNRGTGAIF